MSDNVKTLPSLAKLAQSGDVAELTRRFQNRGFKVMNMGTFPAPNLTPEQEQQVRAVAANLPPLSGLISVASEE